MMETPEQAGQTEITFSWRATFKDVKRASAMQAAASNTIGKGTRILRTMGQKVKNVFMFVLIVTTLVWWLGYNLNKVGPAVLILVGVLGIVAVGAIALSLLRLQGLRTAWKKLEPRTKGLKGAVLRDAIVLESDYSTARMEWPNFMGYDEDGDVLILSEDDVTYQMLTRAMFQSEQDWQWALSIIAINLPRNIATRIDKEEMPAANCNVCSRGFPKTSMVESAGKWSCAKCGDIAAQKLREGVQ